MLQMLSFILTLYLYKLSLLAREAVTPTSILHLRVLLRLFVSVEILHCLIKPTCNCREKCIHTDRSRVPRLCFPLLVISTRCGCLSQRDERLEGARLRAHLRLNPQLSAVSYLPCVGGNRQVVLLDKRDRKPHT